MVSEKTWYESKTIWGALLAVIAAIASTFGIMVDENAQQSTAEAMVQMTGAAGALLAIYGRLSAVDMID